MEKIKNKTIFISPLDWGLGHSTRCLPIIKILQKNNKVIIGVTTLNSKLFEEYFPSLQKINVPSYNINYSKTLPVWIKILSQTPKIKHVIKEENKLLEEIISAHKIDLIISDNRFGLYNNQVESIFITHQLNIKSPFFSWLINKINRNYIHKFNTVWVPDYKNDTERLSGQLSDASGIKIPVNYIEPQSALKDLEINSLNSEKYDYLFLLSGTEPQRSILEKSLLDKFELSAKKIILVRGSDSKIEINNKNISVINFAFGIQLKNIILSSETIICRSGYSTLMDLHVLNKNKLILIPTPGQTEQEYLASYWEKKFGAKIFKQNNLEI